MAEEQHLTIPTQELEPLILKASCQNLSFFMKVKNYLDTNGEYNKSYFSDEKYQIVFNLYSKFFDKYKKQPRQKTFVALVSKYCKENLKLEDEVVEYIKRITTDMYISEDIDIDWIEEETINFIKENRVYEAMLSAQVDLKEKNYSSITSKMEDAVRVNFDKDLGTSIWDYEKIFEEINEISEEGTISTGYSNLDSFIDGGFHNRELYVIAGLPGSGKCSRGDTKIIVEYEIDENGEII